MLFPIDGEGEGLAGVAVMVVKVAVLTPVLVDEAGDFDVNATVVSDFHEFAFFEPFEGLASVGAFADAQGGGGDGVQADAAAEGLFDVFHHVECGPLGGVEDGVGGEDAVVEVQEIVANDEVGAGEFGDEGVGVFFEVDAIGGGSSGVGDSQGDAEFVSAGVAADLLEGFLGFEVEVNDVGLAHVRFLRPGHRGV